jgi:aldose 1-epimerase
MAELSQAMGDLDIRRVSGGGYSFEIAVDAGGSVAAFEWRDPDGRPHPLFRPSARSITPTGTLEQASCFPMVPFANRIDGGRFEFSGAVVEVPVNRPETNVAIHGFSYARPWEVREEREGLLVIAHVFADEGSPYAYTALQSFETGPGGASITLEVRNDGGRPLPFGIGLHPWLVVEAETVVSFAATHGLTADDRRLPVAAVPAAEIADMSDGRDVDRLAFLDTYFANWDGQAVVEWRRRGVRMTVDADGAFRNLHFYNPVDPKFFCIEPVSHLPNVHNRRDFAAYGDYAVLRPGERLIGTMSVVAERIRGAS